jgi:hypothetical protein
VKSSGLDHLGKERSSQQPHAVFYHETFGAEMHGGAGSNSEDCEAD